ncbi:MAG: hypothetical protein HY811_07640 [Planctomycetes bacterium]|nr:hypothetical protein [Planctomycetota bacterium]
MECKEILNDMLVDFNEKALPAKTAQMISDHLAGCNNCRQRCEQIKSIHSALKFSAELTRHINIPEKMDKQIREAIPEIIKTHRMAARRRVITVFASAAAAILIIFSGWLVFMNMEKSEESKSQPTAMSPSRPEPTPPHETTPQVNPPPMETTPEPPVVVMEEPVKGDINKDGELNIVDSMLICQYILKEREITDAESADINGDGKVDIGDSLLIAKKSSGE